MQLQVHHPACASCPEKCRLCICRRSWWIMLSKPWRKPSLLQLQGEASQPQRISSSLSERLVWTVCLYQEDVFVYLLGAGSLCHTAFLDILGTVCSMQCACQYLACSGHTMTRQAAGLHDTCFESISDKGSCDVRHELWHCCTICRIPKSSHAYESCCTFSKRLQLLERQVQCAVPQGPAVCCRSQAVLPLRCNTKLGAIVWVQGFDVDDTAAGAS